MFESSLLLSEFQIKAEEADQAANKNAQASSEIPENSLHNLNTILDAVDKEEVSK